VGALTPLVNGAAPAAASATASVEVSFAETRRPEEATRVRLESFEGPLALLLALIEQRQLDVLTVRLGDLAAAYLEAVTRLGGRRLPLLSAFIAVSAQLILIKSRALLPRPPAVEAAPDESVADPEEELRARLVEYRRYRDAGLRLGARLAVGLAGFRREPSAALAAGIAGARAPQEPPLDPALLVAALAEAIAVVPPPPPPPESIPRTVSLEDRALVIRQALRDAPLVVLQELLGGMRDRVVVAVTFLAMLELVKGRELEVQQDEPWGPIHLRRLETSPARPRAIPIEPDGGRA
jgi:segregation and condensation protein A